MENIDENFKICTKCQENKSLDSFHFHNKDKNTYNNWCKECVTEYSKERWKNGERKKKEALKEEEITEVDYKTCRECKENKSSNDFHKNKFSKDRLQSKCKICQRKYNQNKTNRERHNKLRRESFKNDIEVRRKVYERRKKKMNNDPSFKIRINLASRIITALKNDSRNWNKPCRTIEFLGCSYKFLKEYLEVRFLAGMTWNNYGVNGWHVDHIIPCCSFDLTNPEQQKICFNYTNLRPMWAEDNRKKGFFDKMLKLGREKV